MTRRPPPDNGSSQPPGEGPAGPSPAELQAIEALALELRIALPRLDPEESIHFAAEAIKEQGLMLRGLAQIFIQLARGNPGVAWLETTVFKPPSNILEISGQQETIAVFAGPAQPNNTHTERQILGAAVARSLYTSTFSRALLYASGMRIKFAAVKAPVRKIDGG